MKNSAFVLLLLLGACAPKKETIVITQTNVRDVLTQYGKDNPETEVTIETRLGNMRLKLYDDTPLHRANFIKLIKDGQYDEADFYRIANGFMIQGGNLNKKLNYRVPAEFNPAHFHKKGALSMARVDENNPNKESSAAEFFIVQGTTYYEEDIVAAEKTLGISLTPEQRQTYVTLGGYVDLDQKYTVFGEVIEGLDVIDKIAHEKVYDLEKPLQKIPMVVKVVEKK
ncbi:peptidylprolyl isomerase [Chryseolinea lacunae]|uniref:Peptidyl-prolyl cis-trans isomerase n=1 Tax=Chryseolinea lacunae TaxID=2801331 RepID=A0ABS1KQN9_9BACT|nr:peptidylprolyl isomerase [Chryseolinea lacunae]MBL0741650.1 peptidylprolyl isomerase [Chryseolinea lacunae]